jgi:ribose-phosphate pyrophosphokinase
VGGANAVLREEALYGIVVTDTVPPIRLPSGTVGSRVTVLDTAPFVAEAIRGIHGGGSLVADVKSPDQRGAVSFAA